MIRIGDFLLRFEYVPPCIEDALKIVADHIPRLKSVLFNEAIDSIRLLEASKFKELLEISDHQSQYFWIRRNLISSVSFSMVSYQIFVKTLTGKTITLD